MSGRGLTGLSISVQHYKPPRIHAAQEITLIKTGGPTTLYSFRFKHSKLEIQQFRRDIQQ